MAENEGGIGRVEVVDGAGAVLYCIIYLYRLVGPANNWLHPIMYYIHNGGIKLCE